LSRSLVLIATYNERANAEKLCREILALNLDLDVLFVDDNSPDGTGELLDALARELPPVRVVHRPSKLGVGSAHADGLRWAYDQGYSLSVTMDGDFTHEPRYIRDLLVEAARGPDVVVGSRFLQKSSLAGWNPWRKALTRVGHLLTLALLRMPYDATNAFRCYRLDRIPPRLFDLVVSRGYSFFFESLYVLHRNRFRITEIPIPLPARTYGSSKMSLREVRNSVRLLLATWFKTLFNPEKFELGEEVEPAGAAAALRDDQGWDDYWDAQRTGAGSLLYDAVASFYRTWIIRPTLNRFVRRYFEPGAHVLHAGCGGGQVDVDIQHDVRITALDISSNALRLYKKVNRGQGHTLHGSILKIPLPDGTLDGVYNLGVMEHFTEEEIGRILREFHRVLRPEGRALVFWPPEFGLSVVFFKGLVWIFRNVLRKKDVKFHPSEITRVRSRSYVTGLFESAGFRVIGYSFGPRDLFTYTVIVAQKQ
jgi:dolichol-phosphate mannosyltransferase